MHFDFTTITKLLDERSAERFSNTVVELQLAVAAGMVPNRLFVDAKDTINRAFERGAEAFFKTGPHIKGRDGQAHHQSDWWLDAYDADAFLHGAHHLPSVIKRATKAGMVEYIAFLATLLPVHALLNDAKPLIKKRSELPVERSPKQIADDALRMTCQCCARRIHANLGTIAHHGYERPGHGWQTGSCGGAKQLPFEVSRDRLGIMIANWRDRRTTMQKHRAQTRAEKVAITVTASDRSKPRDKMGRYPELRLEVTRENFELLRDRHNDAMRYASFDDLKTRDLTYQSSRIKEIDAAIREQQARYDGWKQTHKRRGDDWVTI